MSEWMKEMERLVDAHEIAISRRLNGAAWNEETDASRAALLAHSAQAERDAWGWTWQPIETAPTDGTRILLRGRDGKIADGHYGQPDGYANPKQFVWPYIHANPTHWRPLPEPPESAAAPAQADRDAPVELPEPEQYLAGCHEGTAYKRELILRQMRQYGDAREAAGYARGRAEKQSKAPEQCRWFQDGTDSDTWQTGCGSYFMINDGTPSENNMAHCAYCGRHLVEYSWEEEQEGGE